MPLRVAASLTWTNQTLLTSALVLLTASLGIWTQAVLAATLGLSGASDAYFSALNLTSMATFVLSTTVVNRVVPELARQLDPMDLPTGQFWVAARRATNRIGVISAIAAVTLFLAPEWAISLVAPGLAGASRDLAVASLRVMSLPLGLNLASSAFAAVQYALRRQAVVQATGPLYSLAVIPSLIWLTPLVGPISPSIGTAISFVLMFAALAVSTGVAARRRVSMLTVASVRTSPPALLLVVLAAVLSYGWVVVGPIIASTLAEGTIAQVTFAFRPVDVLSRALPMVIGYSVMPTLAAAHTREDWAHLESTASEALRLALGATVPIAALLIALREPLVAVVYQRSAFSAEAARAVAPTLGWYASSLPGYGLIILLTLMFLSVGREGAAVVLSAAFLLLQLPLGWVLGQAFGGIGVASGFSVAALLVAPAGVVASGRHDVRGLLVAAWFRWTLAGAAGALLLGTLASDLTYGVPGLVRLLIGFSVGSAPAIVGFLAGHEPLREAVRGKLTSLRLRPVPQPEDVP